MSPATVIIYLSVLLVISDAHPKSPRITGGQPAEIGDHSWNVQIFYYGTPFCAGAIISPTYVVTNGQCTYRNPPASLTIHAGSAIYGFGGIFLGVNEYFEHPQFEYYAKDYDISVLVLARTLEFSSSIAPVALPENGLVLDPGTKGIASGWGKVNGSSTLATHLQEIEMTAITLSECRSLYSSVEVRSRHLCALEPVACPGDVGSPFVVDNVLIGLVSWGNDCGASNSPVVLANVANMREY